MKVFVYRNLNRKGVVWSVKNPKTGLVVDRAIAVYLSFCTFKVSEAGRQRVLKQKRKNVHAGVEGRRIVKPPTNRKWFKATYNPYLCNTFVTQDGYRVFFAKYVKLTNKGCFVSWE